MNSRPVILILAFSSVAALAFEAGRRTEPPAGPAVPNAPSTMSVTLSDPTPLPPQIDFRNVAYLSVPERVKAIKSASPETLKDWVKALQAIEPAPTRAAAIASFFQTFIQLDAPTATRLILTLNDSDRWTAVMTLKNSAPPRAMEHVVDLLRSFPPDVRSGCSYNFVRDAIEEWSAFDPIAVTRYFQQHAADEELSNYSDRVIRGWAAYDPESARQWAVQAIERASTRKDRPLELGDSEDAKWINMAWIEGYLENDRSAALDYVVQFQEREDVGASIPNVAKALFLESPDEARAFIQRLPLERRVKALNGVSEAANRSVYHDADDWKSSPEFVANWMMEFPTEIWNETLGQVLAEWRYGDIQGMFGWMSQLPPGTREKVASKYSPYLPPDRAEKEFGHVMQVADFALRDRLLEEFMKEAKDSKPETLRALQTAQLSQAQKEHLASLIPERDYEVAETTEEE